MKASGITAQPDLLIECANTPVELDLAIWVRDSVDIGIRMRPVMIKGSNGSQGGEITHRPVCPQRQLIEAVVIGIWIAGGPISRSKLVRCDRRIGYYVQLIGGIDRTSTRLNSSH